MEKPIKQSVPGVQQIIAISSGKGGVGKSTTAINLACALQSQGKTVGILDADIYGPNQPQMLGISARPESKDQKHLEPILQYGLQTMSIGYLIDEKQAAIWRGPMASKALQQLLFETRWQDLDYLILDLPPGTGDIQLTMAQKIPVTGAIIVTTPQDVALIDARKGLAMFEKVGVPVLGLVENMSVYVCPNCGDHAHIFGERGGVQMAEYYQLELLAQLPLALKIRQQSDLGKPIVLSEPDGEIAKIYQDLACKVVRKLQELPHESSYLYRTKADKSV